MLSGWKLEDWLKSVDLSDDVDTLASTGSGLPLVSLTLPQASTSSALTPSDNAAPTSRYASCWALPPGGNNVESDEAEGGSLKKNANEDCWPGSVPLTSAGFSSNSHFFRSSIGDLEDCNALPTLPESSYGFQMNTGLDLPNLCSSPFPFPLETENGSSGGASASPSASFTTTLSEISARLNETSIDNSFLSNGSIWSPTPPACQHSPNSNPISPCLSPKQALQCLQLIQEFQDAGLTGSYYNSILETGHKAHTTALTNLLQQHLLGVLLSPTASPPATTSANDGNNLERAARLHREFAGLSDATFTWSGQLPPRAHRNPVYSCKVFLGGMPWDITEYGLIHVFKQFGNVKVEWPGKEGGPSQPKGYVYIVFENEKQVKALLQSCTHDYSKGGNWYYKISSKKMRAKDVQVIPWALSDSNFVRCQTTKLDPQKTIFVGALHGMLNAEGLANIMQDLFSGVVYAGIDTDRNKYPIGSGRVTFNNTKSYMKAVSAAFVEIRTSKFTKKVQVDPYLEDARCSKCGLQQGPYFCRDLSCFRYFCRTCFQHHHSGELFRSHIPLMRNSSKPHSGSGQATPSPLPHAGNSTTVTTGYESSYGSVGTGRHFGGSSSAHFGNTNRYATPRFPR